MASERSRRARNLAEYALIRFGLYLGDNREKVVIVGGLNPDLLTSDPEVPHQGTSDVDVLLSVDLIFDREEQDFAWLEAALNAAKFELGDPDIGWRWYLAVDGQKVKLELLCDVPDNLGQQIALPGCDRAAAMNLTGPRPAHVDSILRSLRVPPDLQTEVPDGVRDINLPFAGLGGYLLAKAAAAVRRGLDRDSYDFGFVLMFSGESPEAVARAVRAAVPVDGMNNDYLSDARTLLADFAAPDSSRRAICVAELLRGGTETPAPDLSEDLRTVAIRCLRELG